MPIIALFFQLVTNSLTARRHISCVTEGLSR